jgi:hypothetical protein
MSAPQDPFESWKEGRRQIEPPPDFSAHMMARIHRCELKRPVRFAESFFFGLPAAEKALRLLLAFGLSAAGIFRISYVTLSILTP